MTIVTLHAVGNSVVVPIPKQALELLRLQAGSKIEMNVQNGKLVVAPKGKLRYSLNELITKCDFSHPMSAEEREWLDSAPVSLEEN